jgi:hypothetical protein
MFTFTDAYGNPVDTAVIQERAERETHNGADIRNLPLWIAAAREAQERDYCHVYDSIAEAIGGPSRDDLATMGVLDTTFTVEGTRTVTIRVTIPFSTEFTAARPGDVRREFTIEELGDVDSYELADAIRNGNYNEDDDEYEIDSVER